MIKNIKMKIYEIFFTVLGFLILLCGCSQNVGGEELPNITPTPPIQKMSRDANNPEYYFVDKENLENMGMTPGDLTQSENETLIRIALSNL
jgi:hypothetical protein